MTKLEALLKDLEEKADAATPGPWEVDRSLSTFNVSVVGEMTNICKLNRKDYEYDADKWPWDNAQFIAALNPVTVRKLIAVIREMKKSLEYYSEVNKINNGVYLMCDAENTLEDCEKIVSGE